jgi:hypothetical protein
VPKTEKTLLSVRQEEQAAMILPFNVLRKILELSFKDSSTSFKMDFEQE